MDTPSFERLPMFVEVLPRRRWWRRWRPDRRERRFVYGPADGMGVVHIPAGVWDQVGRPTTQGLIGEGREKTVIRW